MSARIPTLAPSRLAPAAAPPAASLSPRALASEDSLTRQIHRAVGGPSALAKQPSPAAVREAVVRALAAAQADAVNAGRVARGALTPLERRVVRTVTNRGAAVRSRARVRREVAELRKQVSERDEVIRRLTRELAEARAEAAARGRGIVPTAKVDYAHKPVVIHKAEVAPKAEPTMGNLPPLPPPVASERLCGAASIDGLPWGSSAIPTTSLDGFAFPSMNDPLALI